MLNPASARLSAARWALLSQGDFLLFDSRVLHCGGANMASPHGAHRSLFYFSFKRAGQPTGKSGPGTLRADLEGRYTVSSLADACSEDADGGARVAAEREAAAASVASLHVTSALAIELT